MAATVHSDRPALRFGAVVAGLMVILGLLAGCDGGDGEGDAPTTTDDTTTTSDATTTSAPDTTTTSAGDGSELAQSCETDRFSVRYPEGWFTTDQPDFRCRYFHPEPFTVERGTEPSVAIFFDTAPLTYDRYRQETGGRTAEVIAEEEIDVSGRDAFRMELRATGEGLYREGTHYTVVAVDLDGETLTATTVEGSTADYGRQQQVLTQMAESLEIKA